MSAHRRPKPVHGRYSPENYAALTPADQPMSERANVPERGQVVRVRQRQYLVEGVEPGESATDATLVRLACLDDDAQGQPLEAFWELEPDAELLTSAGWEHLTT